MTEFPRSRAVLTRDQTGEVGVTVSMDTRSVAIMYFMLMDRGCASYMLEIGHNVGL